MEIMKLMEPDNKNQEPEEKTVKEEKPGDERFSTEEIEIEEMAIDGICGVY